MNVLKDKAIQDNPYKNFPFRVKYGKIYVAGVSKVTGLSPTGVKYDAGKNSPAPPLLPGQTSYGPLELARGITRDKEFGQWLNIAWEGRYKSPIGGDQDKSLEDFRRELVIEQHDAAGQLVHQYAVHLCWVSDAVVMADLSNNTNGFVIERITLQNEGWDLDANFQ